MPVAFVPPCPALRSRRVNPLCAPRQTILTARPARHVMCVQQRNESATATAPRDVQTPLVWDFRGAELQYLRAEPPYADARTPCMLLVHGFGANCRHWRRNMQPLADAGYRVFAVDLIGFGMGDKPTPGALDAEGEPVQYTFPYWSTQLRAFLETVVRPTGKVYAVSNSVGCVASMQAAIDSPPGLFKAHVFISPSLRLLNVRKRSWIQGVGASALQRLLSFEPVGRFFLQMLAKPSALKKVLYQAYHVHDAVDDELLRIISEPAFTAGALQVFIAFITYDTGPIPEDLLPLLDAPALMLWGKEDEFEPITLGRELKKFAAVREFVEPDGLGHCAHDEAPDLVNDAVLKFFASVDAESK